MLESAFSETPITDSACDLHFLRPLSQIRHVTFTFWDPYHTFGMPRDSESCSETLHQFSETPITLWARTFKTSSVFFNFRYDRSWINFLRPLSRFRPVTFNFWHPCHTFGLFWDSESIFWDPYHGFGLWPSISDTPVTLSAYSETLNQFSETPITVSACDLQFLTPLSHFRPILRLWINFLRPLSRFRPVTFNFWHPYLQFLLLFTWVRWCSDSLHAVLVAIYVSPVMFR